MLQKLATAHAAGQLTFHGGKAGLAERRPFMRYLSPLRRRRWFVYSKPPFAGPKAVLAYLARYTHRVAVSNRRLIRADAGSVTFKVKDYRVEGPRRYTTMTLATHEFIRRFLMHVLPKGLHRIRHYGLLANGNRAANLARMRELLNEAPPEPKPDDSAEMAKTEDYLQPCPCCGGRMRVIETFQAGSRPRTQASLAVLRNRHLMNAKAGPRSPIPLFCRWFRTGPAPARPGRSSNAHPAAASGSKSASRPDHPGERRLNSYAFRHRKAPKTARTNHRLRLNPHRARGPC